MLMMALFWIVLVTLGVLIIINLKIKSKTADSFIGFLIVIQLMVFALAIVTKDPLLQGLGIPSDWELLVEGIASSFAVWKYYLSPMKDRIVKLEINSGKLETKITNIANDVTWIKNNCKISFKK